MCVLFKLFGSVWFSVCLPTFTGRVRTGSNLVTIKSTTGLISFISVNGVTNAKYWMGATAPFTSGGNKPQFTWNDGTPNANLVTNNADIWTGGSPKTGDQHAWIVNGAAVSGASSAVNQYICEFTV